MASRGGQLPPLAASPAVISEQLQPHPPAAPAASDAEELLPGELPTRSPNSRSSRMLRTVTNATTAVRDTDVDEMDEDATVHLGPARGDATFKRRGSTAAMTIFEAMDKHQHQHKCAPLYNCWTYALDPNGMVRIYWDVCMLILVVYSCFAVPYKTAFNLEATLRDDPSSSGMGAIDWIVDAIFYCDILLNFWTGYDTGYMIVREKKKIAKQYLRTRFAIDFVSTVEWDLLVRWTACDAGGCTGSLRELNDMTALTRMLKVLRLSRAGPLMTRLTSHLTIHSAYIDAGKFFLYVVVVAHVLACLFYMIPILSICDFQDTFGDDELPVLDRNHSCIPTSWRTNYGLNDHNNEPLMAPSSQYISAFYWSLTTMTTIGYGDRGPGNDPEILFTICAEVLGLSFFALLLQQITTVYDEVNRERQGRESVKDEIVQFMKVNRVEKRMIQKVVAFLHFKGASISSREFDLEGSFSQLSEALQDEIRVAIYRPVLQGVRLFGHSPTDATDHLNVEQLFEHADPDGSGKLDEDEVRALIQELHIDLSEDELKAAMEAMDEAAEDVDDKIDEGVQVTFTEFAQWWYLQRHGRPKLAPCPDEMLARFALCLHSECSSPSDPIVRKGDYGKRLYIVVQGVVEIRDHPQDTRVSHANARLTLPAA